MYQLRSGRPKKYNKKVGVNADPLYVLIVCPDAVLNVLTHCNAADVLKKDTKKQAILSTVCHFGTCVLVHRY